MKTRDQNSSSKYFLNSNFQSKLLIFYIFMNIHISVNLMHIKNKVLLHIKIFMDKKKQSSPSRTFHIPLFKLLCFSYYLYNLSCQKLSKFYSETYTTHKTFSGFVFTYTFYPWVLPPPYFPPHYLDTLRDICS